MTSMDTEQTGTKRLRDRLRLRGPALVVVPVVAAVVLLLVIAVVILSLPKNVPSVVVPPVPVEVLTILPIGRFAETVDLPGVVEPQRVVSVSAEVAGRVERIDVRKGQTAAQGQVMITLNTDLLSAAYRQAKASAELNAKDLERMAGLYRDEAVSASEMDQARAKAEASKAALDSTQADLDRARIVAPQAGVVNRIPVDVGEFVQRGTQVAEIVEVDTVKAVVDVPSRDVAYLKVGSDAQVLTNPDGGALGGEITYISQVASDAARTTPAEITVDNRDRKLHSGQIVTVRLTRRELTDVILVPLEAVIPLEDGKEVYVVEDGRAVRRNVTLGIIRGTNVQITSGLNAGEQLIVGGGQRYVGPEQAVRVVQPEPNEAGP